MERRRWWESSRAPLLIPLGAIAAIVLADLLAPPHVHLGAMLVAAPIITCVFARPWVTAAVGALALGAQVLILTLRHVNPGDIVAQLVALVLVSTLAVLFSRVRERWSVRLTRTQSVAAVAQEVLLQPLPARSGPLRIATLYLAAQREATMGGDLFAAARTEGSTRLLIGDVRGNGLPAYNHAALLLGAFRAASHQQATLASLADHLDGALRWDAAQWGDDHVIDADEAFATAAMVDIPDTDVAVDLVSAGHPPPLLLRRQGGVESMGATHPALPIGFGTLADTDGYQLDSFTFAPGDTLLLYTDGVTEARDADGAFYPLAERVSAWVGEHPDDLLRHLREDLMNHTDGSLRDDAAAVAVLRQSG